jgi:hypothetical protein
MHRESEESSSFLDVLPSSPRTPFISLSKKELLSSIQPEERSLY